MIVDEKCACAEFEIKNNLHFVSVEPDFISSRSFFNYQHHWNHEQCHITNEMLSLIFLFYHLKRKEKKKTKIVMTIVLKCKNS